MVGLRKAEYSGVTTRSHNDFVYTFILRSFLFIYMCILLGRYSFGFIVKYSVNDCPSLEYLPVPTSLRAVRKCRGGGHLGHLLQ
jgi:hypothetical protein